ncbi:MAG: putative two-component sensor histidine kinase protein [Rariglobus sp.]|jgi:PAS domain S-box-containing protein|nr:putative two-component sensor histidine kinase protein [Rariglobus sp.]
MVLSPPTDAFLASLVNSSSDAILSKDLNGVITSWNRGAELIFGYTAAEAIGKPITLIFPPERYNEEPRILERIMRGERIEHYETVRRRKDGSHIDISLTVSPITDANGKIIGASKVARDITEQRREEERLRVTLSSIGDAVVSTDKEGRVVFLNAVAEQLTGWRSADAIGRPLESVFRIVNEATRCAVASPVEKVLQSGVTVGLANHTILIARDGAEHPIDDSAAPIRNRAGELIGVVLVFRDASERRSAELAALRLAAIIEGSDDAIIGKNLKGIINSWNPGAERIFGYTAEEMIGKSITLLLPPERITEEQQILTRLQRGERVDHFQTIRVRKDGRLIHVSLTISPIRDEAGRVIGASKIARDITALRIAQEALETHAADLESKVRERTARLEGMVAELEAFSYSLSHDMRAPLRAIQSFSEIVLTDYGDKIPEGTGYLRRVINAANRMDRLIQDVLSFSRLARAQIEVSEVDVEKLVVDIIQERPELQPPKAIVTVESPLLPVRGHDASLTQCLTNLLGNAVKFVAPGVVPKVNVFTREAGDHVRICVHDNGIGISPSGQKRLFAIFQRLHPIERFEGTGVGLAIVRKAAERMNGTVGIESAEGQGSTFWVELPRA